MAALGSQAAYFYRSVIDDVIQRSKPLFAEERLDASVLAQLVTQWESRLLAAGVTAIGETRPEAPIPVGPPLSHHQVVQALSSTPSPAAPLSSPLTTATVQAFEALGRPQQFMAPRADWAPPPSKTELPPSLRGLGTKKPPKRKAQSRQKNKPKKKANEEDGEEDEEGEEEDEGEDENEGDEDGEWRPRRGVSRQVDGEGSSDSESEGRSKRRRHEPEGRIQHATPPSPGEESLGEGSELDLSADEPETDNLVLCKYDTITRVKNKRRCTFMSGIATLEGRDYVFNKALGEFDF